MLWPLCWVILFVVLLFVLCKPKGNNHKHWTNDTTAALQHIFVFVVYLSWNIPIVCLFTVLSLIWTLTAWYWFLPAMTTRVLYVDNYNRYWFVIHYGLVDGILIVQHIGKSFGWYYTNIHKYCISREFYHSIRRAWKMLMLPAIFKILWSQPSLVKQIRGCCLKHRSMLP